MFSILRPETVLLLFSDNEYNFDKYSHLDADVLNVGYDYQSLMHYGKTAFSKNGEITMQAIGNANLDLGQNSDLDSSDLTQLNALYDCASEYPLIALQFRKTFT